MASPSSPPGFWARVLLPVAAVVGSFAVAIVAIVALEPTSLGESNTGAITIAVAELAMLVFGVLLLRRLALHERRLTLEGRGGRAGSLAAGVGVGVALVIVSVIIIALGTVVDGGVEERLKDQEIALPDAAWALTLTVVALVVLAPLAEELLFRALLFRALARRVPIVGAIAISAIIFATAHIDAWSVWPRAIALVVTGAGLAWIYLRRGYWAAVAAHATVNAVAAGALLATG